MNKLADLHLLKSIILQSWFLFPFLQCNRYANTFPIIKQFGYLCFDQHFQAMIWISNPSLLAWVTLEQNFFCKKALKQHIFEHTLGWQMPACTLQLSVRPSTTLPPLLCAPALITPLTEWYYNKTYQEWWIRSLKPMSGLSGRKNSRVAKPRMGSVQGRTETPSGPRAKTLNGPPIIRLPAFVIIYRELSRWV